MPSPTEMIIVLIIVILIFGGGKIKKLGQDVGGSIVGFRKAMKEADKVEKVDE